MIIFDLKCADEEHHFEGWFGSSQDYAEQLARGLLDCPVCGSRNIGKAAMAPNLGKKANQQRMTAGPTESTAGDQAVSSASNGTTVPTEYAEVIGKLAEVQEKLLSGSEWVGDQFAERARDIHYGEADDRSIHGTASAKDVADLAEEGIAATALPLPVLPPETKN